MFLPLRELGKIVEFSFTYFMLRIIYIIFHMVCDYHNVYLSNTSKFSSLNPSCPATPIGNLSPSKFMHQNNPTSYKWMDRIFPQAFLDYSLNILRPKSSGSCTSLTGFLTFHEITRLPQVMLPTSSFYFAIRIFWFFSSSKRHISPICNLLSPTNSFHPWESAIELLFGNTKQHWSLRIWFSLGRLLW